MNSISRATLLEALEAERFIKQQFEMTCETIENILQHRSDAAGRVAERFQLNNRFKFMKAVRQFS